MERRSFSSAFVLDTRAAATFVTMPVSSRFLVPLLGRECTAGELAARTAVSHGAAGYRLRQMQDLGLVERTRLQARAGRPIAHYRAVADRVFAPLDLTPLDSLRDLFRQGLADVAADVAASVEEGWLRVGRSVQWGTLLYRTGPDGPVNRDFVPLALARGSAFWDAALGDDAPAVWSQHANLDLPDDLAKALQRELAGLVGRYGELAAGRARRRPHHLQLTLAPAVTR